MWVTCSVLFFAETGTIHNRIDAEGGEGAMLFGCFQTTKASMHSSNPKSCDEDKTNQLWKVMAGGRDLDQGEPKADQGGQK